MKSKFLPEKIFNIYEAKSHFSALLDRISAGETLIIAKAGTPIAMLVPIPLSKKNRIAGKGVNRVFFTEEFDSTLPSIMLQTFNGNDYE